MSPHATTEKKRLTSLLELRDSCHTPQRLIKETCAKTNKTALTSHPRFISAAEDDTRRSGEEKKHTRKQTHLKNTKIQQQEEVFSTLSHTDFMVHLKDD